MVSWAVFNSIFQNNITALVCSSAPAFCTPCICKEVCWTSNTINPEQGSLWKWGPIFWKCFCGGWHLLTTEKTNLNPKEFSVRGKEVPKGTRCPVMIIRTFYVPLGNVWRLIPENAHRQSTSSTSSLCGGRGGNPWKKIANADLKCPPISSSLSVIGAEFLFLRDKQHILLLCLHRTFWISPISVLSPYQSSHIHVTGHPPFTTLLWQGWLHDTPGEQDRTRPQLDRQREHFKTPQKSLRLHPPSQHKHQPFAEQRLGVSFLPALSWVTHSGTELAPWQ